jgi:hypothetical protein
MEICEMFKDIKNYICIVKLMTDIPNNTEGICVVCNRHFFDIYVHAVPHHRLITKLKDYGISGNSIEWITNFLLERKQKVALNGSNWKWTDVTSGIPQWSVHGPILFTIYINDLPDIVQNVAKLFSDDTKLYATVINTNDERKLQGDIDRLMQWSKDWLLTFNKSKCKHVHFSPPNNAKYQMGGDYQHPIHRGERPWYHYIR